MPQVPVDFTFLTNLVVVYGMNLVGALLLAVAGFWLAGVAERAVSRGLMASKRMDLTVASFLASLTKYGLLAVTVVAILQLIGVQATSLIAVLGAASLAIGLALQGTLSNMAAGVMLLLFRPFRIGDQIEVGGKNGVVKDLNFFVTELAGGDNVQILIPNASVWGQALINYSAYPTRRMETTVTAAQGEDPDAVARQVREFLDRNPNALSDPAPDVRAASYADGGVELSVRAWAPAPKIDALKFELGRYAAERPRRTEAALQPAE
ncbi:mechanosensitive ion channel family protein [Methylopila sp. M107]|uniref:mechanosensitive ion channel family protein n=1 Tax=Methylopila sp. M107 TaxID=1101190 RepID=UPI000374168E|nr:mechanosensitive ion channel family protein [Methylopila sp. M107]